MGVHQGHHDFWHGAQLAYDTLDTIAALVQLTKKNVEWHVFAAHVAAVRKGLDQETDSAL